MADVSYGSLPFAEQIAFFRRKANVNTQSWLDVWQQAHDHAFMVAGANRDDLVLDFRQAVDAAIANGETLEQFRKRFDSIVAKYGWDYNGGRNWRSRVIYETNLRTSYAAGRWQQLQSIKQRVPYWEYVHSDAVQHPRPQHLAWNGLVLSADDPWWHSHFPPNGWGCQCTVRGRSKRDLADMGKSGPDQAPPIDMQSVTVGQRSPGGARDIETPAGVDPGFGYAPGKDAFETWLEQQAEQALESAAAAAQWQPLVTTTAEDLGRPAMIPLRPAPVPLGPRVEGIEATTTALRELLGADYGVFDVHGLPIAIDAAVLGEHIAKDPGRTPFLPLLLDLLADPFEVWMMTEQDAATGALRTRARLIKGYDLGNGKGVLLASDYQRGQFIGWTFLGTRDMKYLNKQRIGELWYGAE